MSLAPRFYREELLHKKLPAARNPYSDQSVARAANIAIQQKLNEQEREHDASVYKMANDFRNQL